MAFAKSASRRSKTGSPSPAGTPRIRHLMTPPTESPLDRASSMRLAIEAADPGSGQRTGFASTEASVGKASSEPCGISMSWTRVT